MDSPPPPRSVRIAVSLLRTRWLVRAPIWIFRCRLGVEGHRPRTAPKLPQIWVIVCGNSLA